MCGSMRFGAEHRGKNVSIRSGNVPHRSTPRMGPSKANLRSFRKSTLEMLQCKDCIFSSESEPFWGRCWLNHFFELPTRAVMHFLPITWSLPTPSFPQFRSFPQWQFSPSTFYAHMQSRTSHRVIPTQIFSWNRPTKDSNHNHENCTDIS